MKDTFYFSHDFNARNDSKIKKLLSKHGFLGYGLFWAIVEDLYNNANALPTDYDSIAFDLRSNENLIQSVICDFGLFVIEKNSFGSTSIEKRLDERNAKSKKAQKSAFARWNKKEIDANALRTDCDSNVIKESKVKESKENEKKVKKIIISPEVKKLRGDFENKDYFFIDKKFQISFERWMSYKKDRKEKYKSIESEKQFYNKLLKLSNNNPLIAEKIINDSMANNYAGIFEPKQDKNKPQVAQSIYKAI